MRGARTVIAVALMLTAACGGDGGSRPDGSARDAGPRDAAVVDDGVLPREDGGFRPECADPPACTRGTFVGPIELSEGLPGDAGGPTAATWVEVRDDLAGRSAVLGIEIAGTRYDFSIPIPRDELPSVAGGTAVTVQWDGAGGVHVEDTTGAPILDLVISSGGLGDTVPDGVELGPLALTAGAACCSFVAGSMCPDGLNPWSYTYAIGIAGADTSDVTVGCGDRSRISIGGAPFDVYNLWVAAPFPGAPELAPPSDCGLCAYAPSAEVHAALVAR